MFDFLANYTLREKAIVAFALVVMIGLGAHAFVIEPYQLRVAELEEAIEQQRTDLAWMESAVARMPAGGSQQAAAEITGSLANYLDQAVRRQGLAGQLSQMSPIGSDEVRMRYSEVDFNRLVNFIAQISTSGLEVKDIRISAADDPGVVDSSIILVRK